MKATADSSVKRRIWVKIKEIRIKLEEEAAWFPIRVINKWPATIFAIRRTANVKGRIIFLIDSIRTIKGIRRVGVLRGTRWASICFMLLVHPNIIKAAHSGRLKAIVKVKCLEDEKIYGNSPIILLHKMKKNTDANIIVIFDLFTFNKILNSELSFFNIK